MSEYMVGDKAIRNGLEVEVTYGPFTSPLGFTWLVVRLSNGKEDTARVTDLSPVPAKLAVGDKVRHDNLLAEIIGGPVVGALSGEEIVLFKYLEGFYAGKGMSRKVSEVEPVTEPALVPVGTRVRVDRAKWAEDQHGETGVITGNTETWTPHNDVVHPYEVELDNGGTIAAAEVTPVDDELANGFEYEGAVYEYGALYRDREGDLFRFRSTLSDDGTETPQGQTYGADDDEGGAWHWSLAEVLRDYAPLTKQ
ncbi:phiSA1p31-related protein [Streptomyces sp. EN16]|uniref:phiSA1p31-related protein n=1 Tax=Streptomyces sp. EN16 TaxID=212773 RepID=UPI0008519F71|nr:phiSA1p31-related protein [Streptomyces sp. EN16]